MYVIVLVVAAVAASLLARLPATGDFSHRSEVSLPATHASASPDNPPPSQLIAALDHGVELTRDENGHFFADVQINGAPVHMLIDTGADVIALSRNDAQLAGLATPIGMNDVIGRGADGDVRGAAVVLDRVTLGDKSVDNVPAVILNSGGQSLLGQSFLGKFASVKIESGKMVLR